jgi:hypothetical protein
VAEQMTEFLRAMPKTAEPDNPDLIFLNDDSRIYRVA